MGFPVDEAHIIATEQKLGRSLPSALRSRLLRSNGGDIQTEDDDWTLYPVFDPTDRKRIARAANHIILETEQARSWRGFPADAVAIAGNGSGDVLIVRAGCDQIELWRHETGEHVPVIVNWD